MRYVMLLAFEAFNDSEAQSFAEEQASSLNYTYPNTAVVLEVRHAVPAEIEKAKLA